MPDDAVTLTPWETSALVAHMFAVWLREHDLPWVAWEVVPELSEAAFEAFVNTEGVVYGTATAGDYGAATAGNRGTATAGDYGTATAGERGTIIIARWDSELGRRRWVVGEVGVDGIVADTPYRVVDGALVEVES